MHIRIILLLRGAEHSSGELAELTGRSPAAVSSHRAGLRWGRAVTSRHEGSRVFHRLADEHALALVEQALHQAARAAEAEPPHHRTPGSRPA